MNKWTGSAGICINEEGKLLMVLQGAPDEEKKRGRFRQVEEKWMKPIKLAVCERLRKRRAIKLK